MRKHLASSRLPLVPAMFAAFALAAANVPECEGSDFFD